MMGNGVAVLLLSAMLAAQDTADAYRDAGARTLVQSARVRRNTVDRSIERYEARVAERISAGIRGVGQERLVYRREVAGAIDWRREGPVQVAVTGAREAVPLLLKSAQLPTDLERYMGHLAFDPVGGEVMLPLDSRGLRHPLAEGAETFYRYASGDTAVIRLADGREVRLLELRVEPRRADPDLIAGSFWLDAATHDLVRLIFRPAAPRRLGTTLLVSAEARLDRVTIDYGLWELTWWLPHRVWAEGGLVLGPARLPLSYEREYADYTVEGDAARLGVPADSAASRPCRPRFQMSIQVGRRDTTRSGQAADPDTTRTACPRQFVVTVPDDTVALLGSPDLPASVWIAGPAVVSEAERAEAGSADLPEAPWQLGSLRVTAPPGRFRYNRIEGFSPALRADLELGRAQLETEVRMGTADRVLNVEAGIVRRDGDAERAVRLYRRLAVIEPAHRPLTAGSSFGAFFFGSDNGDYYRARGIELTGRARPAGAPGYEWRLFAERQRNAPANTEFSVRHEINEDHVFRPTIEASPASQVGVAANVDFVGGLAPAGWRWGVLIDAEAATGSFDYLRPAFMARVSGPLPATRALLEVAGGVAAGDLPPQRAWLLGDLPTVRGYDAATHAGDAFWRVRAEIGTPGPAARLILFTDWGWAGPRAELGRGKPLASVGVGIALLDGMVRLDVARTLRPPRGWGVNPRFDTPL